MAAAAALLGVAGLAFACTPGGEMFINPPSGRAGSQTTVTGNGWGAHEAQVEVRWNSMSGPLLAKVTPIGGSFSVAVTVPEAPPGVYYIVATAPTRATPGRVAFEITAAPTSTGPAASPETQTSASTDANESAASGGTGQTAATTAGGTESSNSSAPALQRFGPVGATPSEATETNASAGEARQTAASTASSSAQPAGRSVGGGVAPSLAHRSEPSAAAPTAVTDDQPSARTATADLASGFEAGPSLLSGTPGGAPGPATTGSPLVLGAGLLAAGLGTLFAGFAAAELRRRRVPAV